MDTVIVDWMRSPFHRAHKGALKDVRPDEMAGQVARALLSRNNIPEAHFEDILLGCAYPEGEQGYNVARLVGFLSGLPDTVPGSTFNRLCGSSMEAIHVATAKISAGWGDCFLVGGIESMSRVKRRGFNWSPHPKLEEDFPEAYINMGITAENVAEKYAIDRISQEEFALASHQKSALAQQSGLLDDEICPITIGDFEVKSDGCIRPTSNLESMAGLNPVFKESGTVTAATSSPLTDGVTFAIVCSERYATSNGLTPIARIVSTSVTGCPPELMGLGPIAASQLCIERAGWDAEDVDIWELNEAFSSQSLACIEELGIDIEKVNLDGGALSLGHPLGASGARITCKAASLLQRTGKSKAIATMCIGGGMGIATALERY
ncbi:MAG: thiolase family protein [Candidatus Thalassarchaeum sp.]|nr:thiolase family protein [Candidatus Thalassarchaeum sp.]